MSEHDTRRARATVPPAPGEPAETSHDELLLAATAARRFYLDHASKVEIAQELGVSRFKVARLLELAHARGIVRIDIAFPTDTDPRLAAALCERFGLEHAVVVNPPGTDPGGPEPFTDLLAQPAARLVTDLLGEDDVLGLAWGRAVTAVTHALTRLPPCTVVQITGVHPPTAINDQTVRAVHRAAALAQGPAHPLYVPLVLPNALTAHVLRHQPGIAAVLGRFPTVTTAVVAIGAWGPGLSTVHDALEEDERDRCAALGTVAEMASHLFDAEGGLVGAGLDERTVAISAGQLRGVPRVIGVAGGRHKARAVLAVLRSGLLTGLVTDAHTARRALEESSPVPVPPRSRAHGRAEPPDRFPARTRL
ncbi:sugar-binding domain-containing protein [Streptomyces sp. TRM 70361]|uniref:sugar-binding transcriptional regulator n=1 Tax=Streptomyces sp. TRM 70361 TaxID=3116553 RepID=UPI002E7C38E6|nr:sugar-binding domain-containing protein [Streptomyces sp. TRM 70361]MEE1940100.1 sugar-binding domain-containing protein [Streptomyces sp. TRM 70361]